MATAILRSGGRAHVRARIDRSQQLCRETHRRLLENAALRVDFQALIDQVSGLRRRSRHLAPFPIHGGSDDAGLITSALAGGVTLCADCIARRTRVRLGRVTLVTGMTLRVHSSVGVCEACLNGRKVYRLA